MVPALIPFVVPIAFIFFIVIVFVFYLPADFPARRQVRVYVHVGGVRPDGPDHLCEVTGGELLGCHTPGDDICGRDGPSHNRLSFFSGWALIGKIGRIRISGRLAKKKDDAAVHA
jgi:hypothetical protein